MKLMDRAEAEAEAEIDWALTTGRPLPKAALAAAAWHQGKRAFYTTLAVVAALYALAGLIELVS